MLRQAPALLIFIGLLQLDLPEGWSQAASRKPNIVVLMADNLGYGDVGAYGGGAVRGAPTPRIDRLASEGLRLTNFNVESECTPSRSAFMTGRLPIRSGTTRVPLLGSLGTGPRKQGRPYGLDPSEITIAEIVSAAGYDTALYGKWHLGNAAGRLPHDQGFDEWWGYPNSSRESIHSSDPAFDPRVATSAHLMEGIRGQEARRVTPFNIDNRPMVDEIITQKSTRYIRAHADSGRPFFLWTSFIAVHFPTLPHPDFRGKTGNGDYADSVVELDHRVGQILDAIEESGIEDNTLVCFISDNGALLVPRPGVRENWIGNNGPFRGELGTGLEGSVRTIGIIKWPGKIEPGRVSNEIFAMLDLFPTLARVAGATVPDDRAIDGVDQSAFILGEQKGSNREHVLYFVGDDLRAVKWRKFKIHFKKQDTLLGPTQDLRAPEIYNIEVDPREELNITLSSMWVMEPASRYIQQYFESVKN